VTRIVFMGSPAFALPSLERLLEAGYDVVGVYTQPDQAVGRGQRLQAPPVKQFALDHGLLVFQPERLRRPEAIDELAALRPDLVVVAAYGQILRPAVLAIPPHGTVNVHASLLPLYRGPSPVVAAILDGRDITGVTIMLVDEHMDTGPILAQQAAPISPDDTTGTLSDRLATLGADLLINVVPRWLAGEIQPMPQDDSRATVTRLIKKEDGRLDWTLPAEELWRRVRAFTPWPGAVTSLDGVPVRILQAWPLERDAVDEPGSIVPLARSDVLPGHLPKPAFAVQTRKGLLVPLVLQKAGKRALSANDFVNGERGLTNRRFAG
jgi:methionyl-tRNA formyltransferase